MDIYSPDAWSGYFFPASISRAVRIVVIGLQTEGLSPRVGNLVLRALGWNDCHVMHDGAVNGHIARWELNTGSTLFIPLRPDAWTGPGRLVAEAV